MQDENSFNFSPVGNSFINSASVVVVVVVGARVVVVVVVGARVVVVEDVAVVGASVVVVGSVGFGFIVYINPASKASCSFWQVNTVFAFPSES